MDIICPSCCEPYDHTHMLDEFPYLLDGVSNEEAERVATTARFSGQDDPVLIAAQLAGWQFHTLSVFSILRCACCPSELPNSLNSKAIPNRARINCAKALYDILGDDDDAIISNSLTLLSM